MIFHTRSEHANHATTYVFPMKHAMTMLCENLDLFH